MQVDTKPLARVLIVMGVSGSGKTTVGRMLAQTLARVFVDGDTYHSALAIAKMSQSIPLTAEDRRPWITDLIARLNADANTQLVLACSALTHEIRQRFRDETQGSVAFVYLRLDRATAEARVAGRTGHFAKVSLLDSQFDTLEEPRSAIVVDVADTAEDTCQRICQALLLRE